MRSFKQKADDLTATPVEQHRKLIEEVFVCAMTVGSMVQTVYRGIERVRDRFTLTLAPVTWP